MDPNDTQEKERSVLTQISPDEVRELHTGISDRVVDDLEKKFPMHPQEQGPDEGEDSSKPS